jgi:hypothetical protein
MATVLKKKSFKDLSLGQKALIVGGGSLLAYFLLKKAFGNNVEKAPVDYGQIPGVFQTTGGQTVLWDPDPLAKEIAANLEGYNLNVYPETVKKILPLNQSQAALLYNHYNTYYAQDYPTLTQLIQNEWGDWSGTYAQGVAHLKSFGLNDNSKGLRALQLNGHLRRA